MAGGGSCAICGGTRKRLYTVYDDRYGYPGEFVILKCGSCGHGELDVHFTPEEVERLYTDYYPRSHYRAEDYRPHTSARGPLAWLDGKHSTAFRRVPPGVRVLDIGCGFCEALGYHRGRGCEAYGVEADMNVVEVARQQGFNVHAGHFRADLYERDFFDYVTMDQVVEHMADPVGLLKDVAGVLRPGGMVVLSTPNAGGWGAKVFRRKWVHWHAPYHTQYFTAESMALAAGKAGLMPVAHETATNSSWLLFQWCHLLTFPRPGEKSAFWAPGAQKGIISRVLIKLAGLTRAIRLNHLATRLLDAAGMGDNLVFSLRKPQ